jgi:hypothetical protein
MDTPNKIKPYAGEVWKIVETTQPFRLYTYHYSNYGRMKSINPKNGVENLIKGSVGRKGFVKLNLKLKDNTREGYYLHHLVAKAFVTKEHLDKTFIIHKDNIKSNNHHDNLRWVNREELGAWMKTLPSVQNKKITLGSHVKLNPTKVALLKKRMNQNKTKYRILAKQFDITYTQLKRIERGENWGNVQAAK